MIYFARWVVLGIAGAAVLTSGIARASWLEFVAGIIGILASGIGYVTEIFRETQIRAMRTELTILRRAEAQRRNANQRRHP